MRVSNGGSLDAALREVDAPCFALLLLHSVASGRDQCSQSSATQPNARYWVLLVSWRATSVQLSWEPAPALNQPNPPPKSRSARQWRVKTIYLFIYIYIINIASITNDVTCHLYWRVILWMLRLLFSNVRIVRNAYLLQNGWIFGKVPKGEGGHFQSKNSCLGTFNRALWAWNWYKTVISWFRECFFNNCIDINWY